MTDYYPFEEIGPPYWDKRPVAIVGAGPSLAGIDFARLKGPWHVLAVKQKYQDVPWADACFGLDDYWMKRQQDGQNAHSAVASGIPTWLACSDAPPYRHEPIAGAHYVRRARTGDFLSEHPRYINHCGTSGRGALNFATLKKANWIVLFGFDYSLGRDKPEQYPWSPHGHNAQYWPKWAQSYDLIVPQLKKLGIYVLNASPRSNVTAFDRCTVDEGLATLQVRASGL